MIYYRDKQYCFFELFNEHSGTLYRSNVVMNQQQTRTAPEMRSFPELLDIGVMGSCASGKHGICWAAGVDCYQKGSTSLRPNMTIENYQQIVSQCNGKSFQVALGGAGDPNHHEGFEEILKVTRANNIVPNLTTSGYELQDKQIDLIKQYCGAVAVSYYSKLDSAGNETNQNTIEAINRFVEANCITNIHYTISKKNIREAVFRIKHGAFPTGINAIVFLLYKAVGFGKKENTLTYNDADYLDFWRAISEYNGRIKIGFDSCQSPAASLHLKQIAPECIEYCEAARFSMYISSEMVAYPCSFGIDSQQFSFDLKGHTIQEAWNSLQFNEFRKKQKARCALCSSICHDCALDIGVNICAKKQNKN